ncbi:hypothetical protein YC2023_051377 [Brassica napus]
MLKDIEKRWFQKMDSFTLNPNTDTSENDDASKRLTIQELGGLFIIAGVAHALVLVVHLFHTRGEILRVLWESRLFLKLQSFSCLDNLLPLNEECIFENVSLVVVKIKSATMKVVNIKFLL